MDTRWWMALWLGWLLCACARSPLPAPPAAPDEGPRLLTAAEVRAARDELTGRVVTVQGIVTAVGPGWATLQSGGGALLVAAPEAARLAQAVLVSGRVGELEGNLALLDPSEWIVEQEQAALPDPATLMLDATQESLYVQTGAATVSDDGALLLADGRRLRVAPLDRDTARRLQPGMRVDTVRGVLRRAAAGWLLLPALPRDVVVAPPLLAPCEIQGRGRVAAQRGERVETVGVVLGAWQEEEGEGTIAFLQATPCDGDPRTSDALVAALPAATALPQAGDRVRLRGRVAEWYGRTQVEVEADGLLVEERGQPLPAPVLLDPPADPEAARDYFEALEGMRVALDAAQVVGPTTRFGEFAVAAASVPTVAGHLLRSQGQAGRVVLVDDGGPFGPYDVGVGARVRGLAGPLDFTFGAFKLQPLEAPHIEAAPPAPTPTPPALPPAAWSVATLNAENLFDGDDDPRAADEDSTLTPDAQATKLQKIAATLQGPLGLPTLVALQEIENQAVLEQLAAHPLLANRYAAHLLEGNDPRGIDQGLLVERARVVVLELALANRCAPLAAPGGGVGGACPLGEQLLFARPPLVAHLRLDGTRDLFLVNCHFKSKSGGEQETQPRRTAQARFVAALVTQLRAAHPSAEVLVVGDLNDFEQSPTLDALLAGAPLHNLWETLPPSERYAYIFQGVSQVLDHVLVTEGLHGALVHFTPIHVNADFPHALQADATTLHRSSDHDPLLAVFE